MKHLIYIFLILIILLGTVNVCFAQNDLKKEVSQPVQYIWNWVVAKFQWSWDKIYTVLSLEVEKRTPQAEEEFKKETEELKNELKEKGPSWWQRFMNLIYWTPDQWTPEK